MNILTGSLRQHHACTNTLRKLLRAPAHHRRRLPTESHSSDEKHARIRKRDASGLNDRFQIERHHRTHGCWTLCRNPQPPVNQAVAVDDVVAPLVPFLLFVSVDMLGISSRSGWEHHVNQLSRILAAVDFLRPAIDFSEPARAAFDHALALSRAHHAELTVVHAVQTKDRSSWRAQARVALIAQMRHTAESSAVAFTANVQPGDPAAVILQQAQSKPPDLIVLGHINEPARIDCESVRSPQRSRGKRHNPLCRLPRDLCGDGTNWRGIKSDRLVDCPEHNQVRGDLGCPCCRITPAGSPG